MTDETLDVAETFVSLQGESTYAGMPCFFVRLAGCNLRCRYCDTPQALGTGRPVAMAEIVTRFMESRAPLAELTGGEPLLQPASVRLAEALAKCGARVLVETNGTIDISGLPDDAIAVMDIKCPGSGAADTTDWQNVERLRREDEVKFVISDRTDYEWARDVQARYRLSRHCRAVLFSPVRDRLDPAELGRWILDDRLPVRLQIQLHKVVGMP